MKFLEEEYKPRNGIVFFIGFSLILFILMMSSYYFVIESEKNLFFWIKFLFSLSLLSLPLFFVVNAFKEKKRFNKQKHLLIGNELLNEEQIEFIMKQLVVESDSIYGKEIKKIEREKYEYKMKKLKEKIENKTSLEAFEITALNYWISGKYELLDVLEETV